MPKKSPSKPALTVKKTVLRDLTHSQLQGTTGGTGYHPSMVVASNACSGKAA